MNMQSTHSVTIQQREDKMQRYESKNHSDLIIVEDFIGLDANVLVDLVESDEFNFGAKIDALKEFLEKKVYVVVRK